MESHGGEHSVMGEQRPAPGHSTGKVESQQEATGQEIVTAEPGQQNQKRQQRRQASVRLRKGP